LIKLQIMKIKISLLLLIAAAALTQGCVSNKKYAELQTSYTQLQDKQRELKQSYDVTQRELEGSRTRVKSLEEQIASEKSNLASLQDALAKCLAGNNQGNVNIAKLADEINSSNRYIQQLIAAKSKSDSLNMVLTNNLTRSLSQDEMKDVDVQVLKGVVYVSLSDNMLYKSGSYEISDKAGATLDKIAKIIKDYSTYDVLIEGNTDNVPIKQTNIRNNWDLSALRASSVVQALQNNYAVDPKRLTAGGRGEYNPVADNSTEPGKIKNRRTQIIITPKLDQFMDLIGKPVQK
jgi:chemotaxis protein MotB